MFENSQSQYGPRHVLLSVANHADRLGRNAWPSITTIALEAHLSQREVQRAIPILEALGELRVERGAGQNGTHRYSLPAMCEACGKQPIDPDKVSPQRDDKSRKEGVTNTAETMSHLSPEPSFNRPKENRPKEKTEAASRPVPSAACEKRQNLADPQKRYLRTAALAREAENAITRNGPMALPDLKELIKCVAAAKSIPYDAEMVSNAVEIAERRASGVPAMSARDRAEIHADRLLRKYGRQEARRMARAGD